MALKSDEVYCWHCFSLTTLFIKHLLSVPTSLLLLLLSRFSRVWLCATPETAAPTSLKIFKPYQIKPNINWKLKQGGLHVIYQASFSFFKLIYFNWRLITILWWFLPYIDMNKPWVYMCPPTPPRTPLSLPSHPIPLGHPSALALSALCTFECHASNLDWSSISHMVIYMFQCCSLKSSRPHLLPESKNLFFISVSLLFCCIQGCRYHLSKFHVYALVYCIGVFLSDLLHSV